MDRFENCIGLYAYSKVDFKTSRWPRHVWVFSGGVEITYTLGIAY